MRRRLENLQFARQPFVREYTVGKSVGSAVWTTDAQAPDYSYLKGDITQAYTRKVKEAKRSFVFLNLKSETVPAALIVYDKVSASSPDFRKYLVAA